MFDSQIEFHTLEIVKVSKRVLKSKLTSNVQKLSQYEIDAVNAYNNWAVFLQRSWKKLTETQKLVCKTKSTYFKDKISKTLSTLNCNYIFSENILKPIHKYVDSDIEGSEVQSDCFEHLFDTKTDEMAMTNVEFLKVASATINFKYSGDPLRISSFIDSVRLLDTLATTPELETFLVTFIRTKIDGRAREFVDDSHNTINKLIDTLKLNIKPDSSKVIEGRMLSLKLSNSTQEEFAKKAEDLAESLRRSLIIEGMTTPKATEISIDKTIELCRVNTRNEMLIKHIMLYDRLKIYCVWCRI